MHEMKLRMQVLRPALASCVREALPLVGGASQLCCGVTAGKASHNASNARGVTESKMGRNSSYGNSITFSDKQTYDGVCCS